jgi:hypothetical protein
MSDDEKTFGELFLDWVAKSGGMSEAELESIKKLSAAGEIDLMLDKVFGPAPKHTLH